MQVMSVLRVDICWAWRYSGGSWHERDRRQTWMTSRLDNWSAWFTDQTTVEQLVYYEHIQDDDERSKDYVTESWELIGQIVTDWLALMTSSAVLTKGTDTLKHVAATVLSVASFCAML